MHATIALFALSGFVMITEPTWLDDYGLAQNQVREGKRPLAVFVGSGQKGWNRMSQDGKLDVEIKRLLASKYVCLYVDTDQKEGEKLAAAFEIYSGPGLVISDSSGKVQAYRNYGRLPNEDLARQLRRYADSELVVRTTVEGNSQPRRSYYYQPQGSYYYEPQNGGFYQPWYGGGGRSC